jgi:Zn-dependent M28 family amino/carboxypeptidase
VNNTVNRLLECVTVQGIREHLATLQRIADANGGTRSAGTPGFDRSVDYAVRILMNAGYDVTVQPFDFLYTEDQSSLTDDAGNVYDSTANDFDPFVAGTATALLQAVDVVIPPTPAPSSTSGCEAADFAGFTPGSVALIQRGSCDFVLKAHNAEVAGAVAVVIFNEGQPGRDGPLSGVGDSTGDTSVTIPVVFSDFASGNALYEAAQAGPVTVTVVSERIEETRQAENVLAETKTGNDNEVVMVGAHLDSVLAGPGINDNGSGSATILEVAENMRKVHPRNTVRFALWGAEEFNLLGSQHYVDSLDDEQARDVALYLNFDMIASPNYIRAIYDGDGSDSPLPGPAGSGPIEALFEDFYATRGLASEPTEFDGRSDYGPFIAIGIPAGGLFTGAEEIKTVEQAATYGGEAGTALDPCYHAACDTYQNINDEVLDVNSDAVAFATLTYAKSTKSLGVGDAQRAQARLAARAQVGIDR